MLQNIMCMYFETFFFGLDEGKITIPTDTVEPPPTNTLPILSSNYLIHYMLSEVRQFILFNCKFRHFILYLIHKTSSHLLVYFNLTLVLKLKSLTSLVFKLFQLIPYVLLALNSVSCFLLLIVHIAHVIIVCEPLGCQMCYYSTHVKYCLCTLCFYYLIPQVTYHPLCEPHNSLLYVSTTLSFVFKICYSLIKFYSVSTASLNLIMGPVLYITVSLWTLLSLCKTSHITKLLNSAHIPLWLYTYPDLYNKYFYSIYSFSCVFSCTHTHSDDTDFNTNNNSNDNSDHLVVNLSDCELTEPQRRLLSRGLKFCPNPGEPDFREYKDDLDRFHLRLKRELHFNVVTDPDSSLDSGSDHSVNLPTPRVDPMEPFSHQKFKLPSDWIPPVVAPLEYFIQQNELTLNRTKTPKFHHQNISKEERLAFKELTSNSSITVKPADKGGAVVVLNTIDYINEGLRQLSDDNFYIETDTDLTTQHKTLINNKIKDMYEDKEIDLKCHDYLLDSTGRTSLFYMLPKIHKRLENPPGRPIVSGNGCPTEKISQLVDFFLQPHVKALPSYIKDTTHFLRKLNQLGILPKNTILATLDVASLYTNIPNDEGLEAARLALYRMRGRFCNPTNNSLSSLLKMVLTMNNFDFAGRHYLQVGGTAMGTKVAPSFANTFMGWFEDIYVYTYHKQPHIWVRFIDDIFVIWLGSEVELHQFVEYLNNCLPSIKFEAEISTTSVNFLDVTVSITENGDIKTGLYTKPTDAHNYLSYQSCHPPTCKDSIPYSQFLRLRRICSDSTDLIVEAKKMSSHFHRAGYPKKLIQTAFDKTWKLDREELLEYKVADAEKEKEKNFFLITTYHPSGSVLDKIISKNWDLLDRSSSTRPLLEYRIVKGFRRPKNCRDTLIRAKTSNPWDVQMAPKVIEPQNDPDTRACKRNNCKYCSKIILTGRLHCPLTNQTYTTIRKCNCESNNLIYCITCSKCEKMYVGQTKRNLRSRMCEHFRNVTQNNTTVHSVGRHFNEQGHEGTDDMNAYVLQFAKGHPDSDRSLSHRLQLEQNWISRLRTKVPDGLNAFNNKIKTLRN